MKSQGPEVLEDLARFDRRLLWSVAALILGLLLLGLLASGWYLHRIMERERDRLAALSSDILAEAVGRVSFAGSYQTRLLFEQLHAAEPGLRRLRLIDPQGRVLADSEPAGNDRPLPEAEFALLRPLLSAPGRRLVRDVQGAQGGSLREISLVVRGGYGQGVQGLLQVGIAEDAHRSALRQGLVYAAALVAALLAVGLGLAWWLGRHFAQPVRQVALALARERSYWRTLVATIPDMIWLKDPQGRFLACNPSFEVFYGASEAEIRGRRDQDFVDPEQAAFFQQKDREALALNRPNKNEEWVSYVSDGRRVLLETIKTPMYAVDGQLIGVLGIAHDITEHRQTQLELARHRDHLEALVGERTAELRAAKEEAEAALAHLRQTQDGLVQAEKMAGLGRMVAGLAHELNTPIGNALLAASHLADSSQPLQQSLKQGLRRSQLEGFLRGVEEATEILLRNLSRAAELVNSFKQVAVDQTSYQRREFELADLAQEACTALRPSLRRAGIEVSLAIDPGLRLDSYPGPLSQVLINLIQNAQVHAFAPGQGGRVQLGARAEAAQPGWLCLWVSDEGCGIAPELQGRVFDPFYSTRLGQGGTGLGLSIVYSLVTGLLGGRISLSSQPGAGSRFEIQLPCVAPQPVAGPPA